MKRVLVTGASGMLGATLVKILSVDFQVFGTGSSMFKDAEFDYMKFNLTSFNYDELIAWSNPDIIIHSGALTNGNFCAENPNDAFDVNGVSVHKFLKATGKNVKIIYISTDAVFPSSLHLAKETDCVFPENVYGKSKELGEFFLKTSEERNYTIIRTTIVGLNINKNKSGFVEWIINTANNKEELGLFTDVLFTPISIWDLVNEIEFLIKTDNINSEILHIGGELCTKYQFGEELLKKLNISRMKLVETSISSFNNRAKRCTDQSIDSSFYQQKYRRVLPNLSQTVNTIKKYYNEQD
ncbi:sugar nucleotide-binding protein [Tenacibaculum ovolyticum]|uniref:SDR family oxidoreductase n=1 Tax=Tenacibaculum ovolyticum TaxID=104270 RepID=UPI0022F4038A|nr:sugar nucleotide-binding protein [Tenacibaculum ovolyticum]WBX76166.1 sugar nucleotide-binding protein [Tenacibaculum ovolyticum]